MEKQVTLYEDTLIVRDGASFIVYSPFSGKIVRTDEFPEPKTPMFKLLSDAGLFGSLPETVKKDEEWGGFTSLTLLLTRSCNLACVYCYAAAKPGGLSMPLDLALGATQWFIAQLQRNKIRISFHGGGEPTLEEELIRAVVAQAKGLADGRRVEFQITTNGTAPRSFCEWMMENKFNVSISMDGAPDVQNRNRPLANGGESSSILEDTIRLFVSRAHPFTIRMTFSPKDDIRSAIEYFAFLGVKKLHLEPLFPFGRMYGRALFGKESGYEIYAPTGGELLEKFLEAIEICERVGIRIFNSHLHQFTIGTGYFCGSARGRAMTVTHDGLLSGCLEVVDANDPAMATFCAGYWLAGEKRFAVNIEKIAMFQQRHADALWPCHDCFARYTCAGGCAIKAVRAGDGFFGRDMPYCTFTRGLVPVLVRKIAKATAI